MEKEERQMARNRKFGRRSVLKGAAGAAGAAVGSGAVTGFPMIWAQTTKNIVLRQCGTGVSA
ncbi:MAG TPA: twin-arginine translocation signal domain-containing protein, partial [Reyranella sp.]|nr:twin-arginine translocation signal domain-containing protein [Reyranella sp.]